MNSGFSIVKRTVVLYTLGNANLKENGEKDAIGRLSDGKECSPTEPTDIENITTII